MKIYAFLPFHNIYLTQKRFYDRMEKKLHRERVTFMIQKRNIAVVYPSVTRYLRDLRSVLAGMSRQ